jgi:thiamine biosynthesis protein ThiS
LEIAQLQNRRFGFVGSAIIEERSDVEISVNGETRQVEAGCTVAKLLEELQLQPRYLAVERNRELVPRATHAACVLQPEDCVEIVTLVGGG